MDRQRYRRRRVSGRGSLHRAEEGRAIQSGSTIMAIRFFVQYNNNNGSPLRSVLGSATAATTAATIESIRPIRPPSLPPSVAAVRMIMGKESLHISPIHLSFGVTEGETRSGPLTFLGRTDGDICLGNWDGRRRSSPSMAQHNGAAVLPETGREGARSSGADGRDDGEIHCPAPERAARGERGDLHWLHRAPHYPPINSPTPPRFHDSLYVRPSRREEGDGRTEGRGVQNKSCLKSGKSLDGISDPAVSVSPPVDPFQTVAHTHYDDPSCGRPTGRPRADRNPGILMGLQCLELDRFRPDKL